MEDLDSFNNYEVSVLDDPKGIILAELTTFAVSSDYGKKNASSTSVLLRLCMSLFVTSYVEYLSCACLVVSYSINHIWLEEYCSCTVLSSIERPCC